MVRAELEALFAERTRAEWEDALGDVDAAVGGVYSPAEMVDHPQLDARDMIERSDDAPPNRLPRSLDRDGVGRARSPCGPGEHTESLLSAVGYTAAELEELRQAGVVRY